MKTAVEKLKIILPTVLLFAAILVFCGLTFLPSVRNNDSAAAAVTTDTTVDAEAMRVLGCCDAYVASHDFECKLDGTVRAKAFGVPYKLNVSGARSVRDEKFSETAESVSAFVKAGIRRESTNGGYAVCRGKYKNKKFNYGAPQILPEDSYKATYGRPKTGLVKYDVENAVVSAKCVGDGMYRFVLDPVKSTYNCRNEVKTVLNSKKPPEYSYVEFTLVTDGEKPIKIAATEKFKVDKFNGVNCTAAFTEVFSY